jgi:hypothetical protein
MSSWATRCPYPLLSHCPLPHLWDTQAALHGSNHGQVALLRNMNVSAMSLVMHDRIDACSAITHLWQAFTATYRRTLLCCWGCSTSMQSGAGICLHTGEVCPQSLAAFSAGMSSLRRRLTCFRAMTWCAPAAVVTKLSFAFCLISEYFQLERV